MQFDEQGSGGGTICFFFFFLFVRLLRYNKEKQNNTMWFVSCLYSYPFNWTNAVIIDIYGILNEKLFHIEYGVNPLKKYISFEALQKKKEAF